MATRILTEVRTMRPKAETMRNALLDPKTASITVVTIPEKAAVEESRRLIETVESHGVIVSSLVINHVIRECDCQFCQREDGIPDLLHPGSAEPLSGKENNHPARLWSRGEGGCSIAGGRGSLRKGQMETSAN